jgi:hypothetical protein
MGLAKGKCTNEQRKKGIIKSFNSRVKEGYIFGQRGIAGNVQKVMQKEMQRGNAI